MNTIFLILLIFLEETLQNMRCYVDLPHRTSVQCGRGYSCLKVVQQPKVFDAHGQFVPLLERQKEEVVYRGCFVLDIHKDICYLANNGLQYCWCSSKDLCNGSPVKELYGPLVLLILMKYLVTL